MRLAPLVIGMGMALSSVMPLPVLAQDARATLVRQIVEAQQLPSAWSESLSKSAETNAQMAKGFLDEIAKQSGGTVLQSSKLPLIGLWRKSVRVQRVRRWLMSGQGCMDHNCPSMNCETS